MQSNISYVLDDYLNFMKLRFVLEKKIKNCIFSLYIKENGKWIKYPYSESPEFILFKKDDVRSISIKLFIRNLETNITNQIAFKERISLRKSKGIKQLDFSKSFEVDVIQNWKIPIKFKRKEQLKRNKIVVFLNGALTYKRNYPIFRRISWSEKFTDYHCLYIFDSTVNLADEYFLGWYFGTGEAPLLSDLESLVIEMKSQLNITNEDIIFYGSSGGGFAALKTAEMFEGSTAVVINPQTNILKYNIKSELKKFINFSLGGRKYAEIRANYLDRLIVNPKKFTKDKSSFIYVQNTVDRVHYQSHFKPFWCQFNSAYVDGSDMKENNKVIIYSHPSGHAGEPDEVFEHILAELM